MGPLEWEYELAGKLFTVDLFLPKYNLIFEINERSHFYPYVLKKDNVTNFKTTILREIKVADSKTQKHPKR